MQIKGILRRIKLTIKKDWILYLILLAALLFRLYHVTYPISDVHAFRQTQTATVIRNFYREGINLFYPKIDSLGEPGYLVLEFPFYQAIVAILYHIFSPNIIYGRLASIFFGLLGAIYLYKIVERFLDKRTALFSTFFFLFAPLNTFYQRVPMIESFAICTSLMILYYCMQWILYQKTIDLVIGVIIASLGLIVKPPYAVISFFPIIYLQVRKYGLKRLFNWKFVFLLLIPITVVFVWQYHANKVNEIYNNLNTYPYRQLFKVFQVKLYPLNTWYFGTLQQRLDFNYYVTIIRRIFALILTPIGLVLLLLAIPVKSAISGRFFEVWLAAAMLSILVVFNLNYVHDYYQLPVVPVCSVFSGYGLTLLITKINNQRLFKKFRRLDYRIVISFLLVFLGLSIRQLLPYFNYDKVVVERGRIVDQATKKGKMVAVCTLDNDIWDPTFLYFCDRRGFKLGRDKLSLDMIDYLVKKGVKYLVLTDYQTEGLAELDLYYGVVRQTKDMKIYDLDKSNK